jgi:hypothetical protein
MDIDVHGLKSMDPRLRGDDGIRINFGRFHVTSVDVLGSMS